MTKCGVRQRWQSKEVARTYEAERFQSLTGRFYHRLTCRALNRCLKRMRCTSEIADIPCGTGRMLPVLSKCASSVIGVDISEAMMEQAKLRVAEQSHVRFMRGDAGALPLGSNSIDVIVSVRFAMHLSQSEREAILREFDRVTRAWIVIEYGYNSYWHAMRRFVRSLLLRIVGRRPSYPKSTSRQQILNETRRAGLEVQGWYWTLWGLSESVFVAMTKRDTGPPDGNFTCA